MNDRFKLSLSGMWLLVSLFAVVWPIFLPSYPGAPGLMGNPIGTATATMFILSFPSSLFGLPLMFIANVILGNEPNSIQGMYVNLLLLFVLGLVQWFWIVPRVLRSEPAVQALDLLTPLRAKALLTEQDTDLAADLFDAKDTTPLERAMREKD